MEDFMFEEAKEYSKLIIVVIIFDRFCSIRVSCVSLKAKNESNTGRSPKREKA